MLKSWNSGLKEVLQMLPLLCSGLLKHVSVAVNAHSSRGTVGGDAKYRTIIHLSI
jgi:hypothetical protein